MHAKPPDQRHIFVQKLVDCAGTQRSVATGYPRDILDKLKGNTTPTAPVELNERVAFEYHHRICDLVRAEYCPGYYRNQSLSDSWDGGQARAEQEIRPGKSTGPPISSTTTTATTTSTFQYVALVAETMTARNGIRSVQVRSHLQNPHEGNSSGSAYQPYGALNRTAHGNLISGRTGRLAERLHPGQGNCERRPSGTAITPQRAPIRR